MMASLPISENGDPLWKFIRGAWGRRRIVATRIAPGGHEVLASATPSLFTERLKMSECLTDDFLRGYASADYGITTSQIMAAELLALRARAASWKRRWKRSLDEYSPAVVGEGGGEPFSGGSIVPFPRRPSFAGRPSLRPDILMPAYAAGPSARIFDPSRGVRIAPVSLADRSCNFLDSAVVTIAHLTLPTAAQAL